MHSKTVLSAAAVIVGLSLATPGAQAQIPLVDSHIHYSHDAWDILPPAEAIKILRKAGLKKAFVSALSEESLLLCPRADIEYRNH